MNTNEFFEDNMFLSICGLILFIVLLLVVLIAFSPNPKPTCTVTYKCKDSKYTVEGTCEEITKPYNCPKNE